MRTTSKPIELQSWKRGQFLITTDSSCVQLDRVHQFLSTDAYWSHGIPRAVVEEAVKNSLCFSVIDESANRQVGFARVVTDHATFAWICDVYVESDFRGRGLSIWLMECVMAHPSLKGLRRICLATKDAHSLYEKFGFVVTQTPGNWLEIKDNDVYLKGPVA